MKYHEARKQFKQALNKQQTITIPKLKTIMQSMNISDRGSNVRVMRNKNNIATVIHYNGRRYIYDSDNK